MKLVASLIVHNELGRYLKDSIAALLEFCDEIRAIDDGSTDGTGEWLMADAGPRVHCQRSPRSLFFEHEGHARQELLNWTLHGDPTHVLAIDADEFVADGHGLRAQLERSDALVFNLCMEEVWNADRDGLQIRSDGGWRPHWTSCLWAVPATGRAAWRIDDRQLACGREPIPARRLARTRQADDTGISLLHFGWTRRTERERRYQRYAHADGGRFHASSHLRSILQPDSQITLDPRPWPDSLNGYRDRILATVTA